MTATVNRETDLDETVRTLVYRWAYRVLGNHHDALDAAQDVLVKWLSRDHDGIESPTAWLRRVTMNHCVDQLRRQRRVTFTNVCEAATAPAQDAAVEEPRSDVAAAFGLLTEQQRSVVAAKVFDEETFAAIATSMGLSASTVKTHFVRGLQTLRDALAVR